MIIQFILLFIFICTLPSAVRAESTPDECISARSAYRPKATPEGSLQQELQLVRANLFYCTDLTLYDEASRGGLKKDPSLIEQVKKKSGNVKRWADAMDSSKKKVVREGKNAVIVFSNPEVGPLFLFESPRGWVIDKTAVLQNVHYTPNSDGWMAYVGNYPYLPLLVRAGVNKRGTTQDGGRKIDIIVLPGLNLSH